MESNTSNAARIAAHVRYTSPYDLHLRVSQRPTFIGRTLNALDRATLMDALDRATHAETNVQRVAGFVEALRIVCIGWENFIDSNGKPLPFDLDRIVQVLTLCELQEVAFGLAQAGAAVEYEAATGVTFNG